MSVSSLKRNKAIRVINALGLAGIGAYSFFSSLLESYFAEIHIQPKGLDFPVFLSEILLLSLLVLLCFKLYLTREVRWWHWAWAVYGGWVLFMALGVFLPMWSLMDLFKPG